MQIQLLRYTGERNRVVKTDYLIGQWVCDGNLKDKTSILNPVIIIEKPTAPINNEYNYMYIPEFKRYYFITDIKSVRNDLWEIQGRVDVLFTYCENILNTKCIIDKTALGNDANLYLNDGSYVMDSHKYNEVKVFPSGLSSSGYNILICAGG